MKNEYEPEADIYLSTNAPALLLSLIHQKEILEVCNEESL